MADQQAARAALAALPGMTRELACQCGIPNYYTPLADVKAAVRKALPQAYAAAFESGRRAVASQPVQSRTLSLAEAQAQLAQIQAGIAQLQQENAIEAAQRSAENAQQLALDGAFGIAARGGVRYSHGVQSFGAPVRAGSQPQAEPPPQPRSASASRATNVQTFGASPSGNAADQARIAAAAAKLVRAPIASGDEQRQRDLDAAFGL